MLTAGINGFGRFGLHLLKYYLDRFESCNYEICYINDDTLSIDQIYNIIVGDKFVKFKKYKVLKEEGHIVFKTPDGNQTNSFVITNTAPEHITWAGKVDLFFECSGKYSEKDKASIFIKDQTKHVIISQTSWDCDSTLIYGFNHEEFNKKHKIISYGSCTVNAFTPLANYIDKYFTIEDSDVNVVHNIQEYRLKNNYTLLRKFCTLEKSGVLLMPSLEGKFRVNYTVVPYDGVSMIDFRFAVSKKTDREDFLGHLKKELAGGSLKNLYGISENDEGPEEYSCTPYSSVFIESSIDVLNNNIHLLTKL